MINPEARPSSNKGVINNEAEEFEPRPFENTIIALDVDGVLVRPNAYRLAVGLTINFFAEQLGIDPKPFMVDDRYSAPGRNMSHFEAEGIHDPWDVSAIIVSLMKLKKAGIDVSNGEALEAFRMNANPQSHPPEVILEWIIKTYKGNISVEDIKSISRTLSKTRNPFKNEVTSVFQEYVLGIEAFEDTYGRRGLTGAEESLIKTKDQSLVDGDARKEIERISQGGGMVIVYTGRPGLPPDDARRRPNDGYAPEAELAVEKSKVNALGTVSMGSMEWLARKTGTPVESLTKPNPTQALAAILAGIRGRVDAKVLLDAYEWGRTGETPDDLQPFVGNGNRAKLEIVVVEDSPSGIIAFINAIKILKEKGVNVELSAIGVHGVSREKYVAFKGLAQEARIFIATHLYTKEGIIQYVYDVLSREENGGLEVKA